MRPKAVVFVGNGFTIGLSNYLGIADWHDTTRLLPPKLWVQLQSSSVDANPLWSEVRYPDLWDQWRNFSDQYSLSSNPTFHEFCKHLAAKRPAFNLGPGFGPRPMLVYSSRDPGYQLRRYLWHLFHYYANRFSSHIIDQTKSSYPGKDYGPSQGLFLATAEWPLVKALRELAKIWDLTLVSFNYDSYLEQVLRAHGCNLQTLRFRGGDVHDNLHDSASRVIHPHGELGTHRPVDIPSQVPIDDNLFSRNDQKIFVFDQNDGDNVEFHFPPSRPCPDFPDIVPPGHNEEHLIGLSSRSRELIQGLVANANVVGLIGFSGAAPDDKEFESYVGKISENAMCFSIGLKDSVPQSPSYLLLSRQVPTANFRIFDISETDHFMEWVSAIFTMSAVDAQRSPPPPSPNS